MSQNNQDHHNEQVRTHKSRKFLIFIAMQVFFIGLVAGAIFVVIRITGGRKNKNNNDNSNTSNYYLSRLLLLDVHGSPASLSPQDLIFMADIFKDVYQRTQDIACSGVDNKNPFLNLTNVEILPNEVIGFGSEPRVVETSVDFSFLVQLDFVCEKCQVTNEYNLFESQLNNSSSSAVDSDAPQVSAFASTSQMISQPCVPNHQDFISSYAQAAIGMIPGLDMIYGVDVLRIGTDECNNQENKASSKFESTLSIAFYGSAASSDLNAQLAIVERVFIATYNELNTLNSATCDPYSRIVTNATAVLYEPNAEDAPTGARRRKLTSRIGYDWNFLNIYFRGTCYGCPSDACLINDVAAGDTTCDSFRRRHLLEGNNNINSCYCTNAAAEESANNDNDAVALPTKDEFLLALEEQFKISRKENEFTLVDSIVYLIEDDVLPDPCCGWPINGNLPVNVHGADFQAAVASYINNGASIYGYPINCWDVSNVTNMTSAFQNHKNFNEPLSCWDTSKVMKMRSMFHDATIFNSNISTWNTSRVTSMDYMFYRASNFNADISAWDTSRVTTMGWMFREASIFNADLSAWKTSKVTIMRHMFTKASLFNSNISAWDISKVTAINHMFHQASIFNADLSAWNTSRIIYMNEMFGGALKFNSDISAWDTSKVTTMSGTFNRATSFNIGISAWDTNKVTTMNNMFNGALQFQQNLCRWGINVDNLVTSTNIFFNTNCPNTDDPSLPVYGPWCFTCLF